MSLTFHPYSVLSNSLDVKINFLLRIIVFKVINNNIKTVFPMYEHLLSKFFEQLNTNCSKKKSSMGRT